MSEYTAQDFEDAQFAEHPDGRLAHRVEYGTVFSWSFEHNDADDYAANEYMVADGWAPVPAQRTITRSEYRDTLNGAVKVSGYGDDWERGFNTGLAVSGTKVVPDPEPTNAEKLKAVLDAIGDSTAGYREHLASKLDEAGVKAPGGDDDH